MTRKKITALILTLMLVLQLFSMTGCSTTGSLAVYDGSGKALATLTNADIGKNKLTDSEHAAYLELVLEEAVGIIAEAEGCTAKKAEKQLFSGQYSVHTAFDPTVFAALKSAYEEHRGSGLELGCAVTDLNGQLLAVFSAGKANRAAAKTAPYTTLAPLSIYASAIDANTATWSSVYRDAPLKKVENAEGEQENWPAGEYTYESTTLNVGCRKNLSTVAVRCLQELGASQAAALLEQNYGIILGEDPTEEELLGELESGVSPIDMAGYYQVFARGGSYAAPKTVTQILDPDGNEVYIAESDEKQVIKETTAYIMNQMLQGATAEDGIAAEALFGETPVAGTVGTGEEGSWFVGVTPEYSCAVWHSADSAENRADEIFAAAMKKMTHSEDAIFSGTTGLQKAVYCAESGLLYNTGCIKMQMGYYDTSNVPATCDQH